MRTLGVTIALLALAAQSTAAPLPRTGPVQALDTHPFALLELDRARGHLAVPDLLRAGAVLVSRNPAVWRVRSDVARRLLPALRRAGTLRAFEPDRPVATRRHLSAGDPLLPQQWWLAAVGADRIEPPAAGRPVTVVDSGVDLAHAEFAARPNTTALNPQTVSGGAEEHHGTAVASLVGAPANGVGVVGVYPQAVLRSWDASPAGALTISDIVGGIDAAARAGAGVINLSLGSPLWSPILEDAVLTAFGRGSLIVAAAGNDREQGSPLDFPANLSHVLTVAATDESNVVTAFSSASLGIDLAAPGQNLPVAVPTSFFASGFAVRASGTSFSAPIVSGAAGWVWTARPGLDNTQIFELLRSSAQDLGPTGFDPDTGFGLLDIPAALTAPAPARDPQEPNDDVDHVEPNGLFVNGRAPLTRPGRPAAALQARLDQTEDPSDVYRLWVPARHTFVATVKANADVDLQLWGPRTRTVQERGAAFKRDRLAASARRGVRTEIAQVTNRSVRGAFFYVHVFLGAGVRDAGYRLSIATRAPK